MADLAALGISISAADESAMADLAALGISISSGSSGATAGEADAVDAGPVGVDTSNDGINANDYGGGGGGGSSSSNVVTVYSVHENTILSFLSALGVEQVRHYSWQVGHYSLPVYRGIKPQRLLLLCSTDYEKKRIIHLFIAARKLDGLPRARTYAHTCMVCCVIYFVVPVSPFDARLCFSADPSNIRG